MRQVKKGKLQYFVFDNLEQTGLVSHMFTTRHGGVSEGCCESLNLGFNREHDRKKVEQSYRIIAQALDADYHNFVLAKRMIHSTNIYVVTKEDAGKGMIYPSEIDGYDGFITNVPGLLLVTTHADCVPLYFLEPDKRVIAVSHAGWRGTVNQIAKVTVEKMADIFACDKKKILVGIGPSIGPCCFEVEKPVVEQFEESLSFAQEYITPEKENNDKYKIDLWGINERVLLENGVLKEHIEQGKYCTKCHPDLFFSHRVMQENRGTMAAVMCLKE